MGDGKAVLGAAVHNQLVGECGLRIPAIADLLEPTDIRPSALTKC
jgi:hypothetical protein